MPAIPACVPRCSYSGLRRQTARHRREEPESATVVGIPVTELRGLFPSLAVKQLPTPLSSAPSPAASRASPSEPALPASGRNLVASPPAPELEQDAEPPRVALEPIGRPLAEFPGPAPAREVAVQPPAEPVSVVSSAPVSEVPTPAPKAGAAAKSETATARARAGRAGTCRSSWRHSPERLGSAHPPAS